MGACYVHFSSYSNDATASGAGPSSGWSDSGASHWRGTGTKSLGTRKSGLLNGIEVGDSRESCDNVLGLSRLLRD